MWDINDQDDAVAHGLSLLSGIDAKNWLKQLQIVRGELRVQNMGKNWYLDPVVSGSFFGIVVKKDSDAISVVAITHSTWETNEDSNVIDDMALRHPLIWFPMIPWTAYLERALFADTSHGLSGGENRIVIPYRQPVLRLVCPDMVYKGVTYDGFSLSLGIAPVVYRRLDRARRAGQNTSSFILGHASFTPVRGWPIKWGEGGYSYAETLVNDTDDTDLHDGGEAVSVPLRMGWD